MQVISQQVGYCPNQLLGKLSGEQFQALAPMLELVRHDLREVLYERDAPIPYVYFPCTAVHSVLILMENGAAVEVGTVGNEGMLGVELLVGARFAVDTAVCQIAGSSIRMKSSAFHEAVAGPTVLRRIVECYCQGYLSLVSQSAACNRLHSLEGRFARWLLVTHDRVQGDEFHLTQELLAEMLGVQRPTVSLVAARFQQAGIIRYSRGAMQIVDRQALEDASCECYARVREYFSRVFNGSESGGQGCHSGFEI